MQIAVADVPVPADFEIRISVGDVAVDVAQELGNVGDPHG